MTADHGGNRCKYCWRPSSYRPQHGEGLHNDGCPEASSAGTTELREWGAGYAYGFANNHIPWWKYRNYSQSFLLGHRVGEAEIDQLVEQTLDAYRYGEEW
jgi:hypothetical protein